MKKIFLIASILLFSTVVVAQAPRGDARHNGKKEKIESIITDLTPQQKSRIDAITQKSSKNVEKYRSQLEAVRDSIRLLMIGREDKSSKLFPLYDREGRLQSELSKEYYRTKVAIDAVLTPEQYQRLRDNMDQRRQKGKQRKHGGK
ncbi:MAG: periplasmic heavy metal sensor [Bacteroidales bacterium]|nr:periplasmic heavy metal sensor [Bacteroidales bacterium]